MRSVLIVVAIGASLALVWVAWRLAMAEQIVSPDSVDEPDYTIVIVLGVAAAVMAAAAAGMIARRAEGAYLLSVGAFMLVMPLALLAFLSVPWSGSDPGPIRLLGPGLFVADLVVAVLALRLGREMSKGSSAPPQP